MFKMQPKLLLSFLAIFDRNLKTKMEFELMVISLLNWFRFVSLQETGKHKFKVYVKNIRSLSQLRVSMFITYTMMKICR